MKKVFILEKFIDVKAMEKSIADAEEMLNFWKEKGDQDAIIMASQMVGWAKKDLEDHPEGYWRGWHGKIYFSQLVECARPSILREPNAKYRVMDALIEDDAEFWTAYKFAKENKNALKRLQSMI